MGPKVRGGGGRGGRVGGPNPERVGPRRVGPRKVGAPKGGQAQIDNHKSTSDGPKNTAHVRMRLRPKMTPKSLQRQSATDVTILGYKCSTAQVRTAPWINGKIPTKPSKSKNDNMKSLAKLTQDSFQWASSTATRSTSRLAMKHLNESTRRLTGDGAPRIHQQALLLQDGNLLHFGNLLRGDRQQVGMNSDFSFHPSVKVFRLQAMAIWAGKWSKTTAD